jgi:hypothetical protein
MCKGLFKEVVSPFQNKETPKFGKGQRMEEYIKGISTAELVMSG